MLMLSAVHIVSFMLPASPLLVLVFGVLGLFIVVRIAARFLEILPG